jgi:hypothetical protein
MDNFTSASLNFLNKDLSFDVGKKFIQILWKAQKYHKHIFQKQILCNRWRFKTKFWIWFKKANKTQPLTFKSAIKELPSLTTLLSQTNFFYNKLFLKRLIAFNGILINGFPLKNLFFKLLLGDIIQLSPNIKVLDNYTNFLTKQQHIKSQYIKNINKVITVSQWRQRKEIQPNTFNTFLKNNNNFIPYWTQVDLFISALTPIKHPKTLLGVQHEDNNRYMLDKLTPWRLKI